MQFVANLVPRPPPGSRLSVSCSTENSERIVGLRSAKIAGNNLASGVWGGQISCRHLVCKFFAIF